MMTNINYRDTRQVRAELEGLLRTYWASAGRGAPDEVAAVALHHPGDMMYRDHGIGEGSGFPAVMAGGSIFLLSSRFFRTE